MAFVLLKGDSGLEATETNKRALMELNIPSKFHHSKLHLVANIFIAYTEEEFGQMMSKFGTDVPHWIYLEDASMFHEHANYREENLDEDQGTEEEKEDDEELGLFPDGGR